MESLTSSSVIGSEMTILVIGNPDRREFFEARAAMAAQGLVVDADGIDAACAILAGGEYAFDIIVLAEDHPGQYSADMIDRLRRWAPLARVVGLLGSWCEGQGRTGRPRPGVIRVYWHQWLARFGREAARLHTGAFSSWCLPATAAEEERILTIASEPVAVHSGRIGVYSRDLAMYQWLAAACCRAGYSTTRLHTNRAGASENLSAVIVDEHDCDEHTSETIRRLVADMHPAPVIAILGFPRVDDRDRAIEAGAAAVLSKPVFLDDLYWQLDQLHVTSVRRISRVQPGS